jgi:hypothetical protein
VFARRAKLLTAACENEKLVRGFAKFAKAFDNGALLRATEIAWMMDPGTFAMSLRETLRLLDDPSTDPRRLVSSVDLEDLDYLLVGWGTKLTAAERQETAQRRKANQVVRAERQQNDQLSAAINKVPPAARRAYSASATFKVDDIIEHAKFGTGLVTKIVDVRKVEVRFADGVHVLVHKP